ncbi:MAG: MATE family efflux transporter [Cellvibrionaceae bacterium]|nr:MATE family efflux transporter [Cellvibrionaceae bacterium]
MLLQSAMGMADVYMVEDIGQVAVAAVGMAAKLHFLLTVLMAGLATACSVLIAQNFGAKNLARCKQVLCVTLVVGALLMLPCIALFSWNNQSWLRWINPDSKVIAVCSSYLVITAPALLITQFIMIYEAATRSLGNTSLPLAVGTIAGIANIALNYVFINGKLGFPPLGVDGAAWGTLVARALQLLLFWCWLYAKRHQFAIKPSELRTYASMSEICQFLSFSMPLMINYLVWATGNAAYHVFTGYTGTHALAAMGIFVPVETAFFALFIGLANASSIMIGHALGANKLDEAWRLSRFFSRISLALAFGFCATLYFLQPWILGLFSDTRPQTLEAISQIFSIFCCLSWIKVLNLVRIIGVLRAGGDNRFVLMVDTLAMWVIGLPIFIGFIFVLKLPFALVYLATFIEDIIKTLPVYRRIEKRIWLRNLSAEHVH